MKGPKKRIVLLTAAVAVLAGIIAVPSLAAGTKTISETVNPTSATGGTSVQFSLKMTNTTPGSSNPVSARVTAPVAPSQWTITAASINQAASNNGTNGSATVTIGAQGKTVDFNNFSPVQQNKYITFLITTTIPSICPQTSYTVPSGSGWSIAASTGTPYGSAGQPFTLTTSIGANTTLSQSCNSAPTPITIDAQTPVRATPATSANFLAGSSLTLYSSGGTGSPDPTITWQYSATSSFPSSPTSKGTGSTLALTNLQAADAGYYRAVASNIEGSSTSNVIQLSQSTVTLEFSNAPSDALVNTAITGTNGQPVAVQLKVDGSASSAYDGTGVTITATSGGSDASSVLSGKTATIGNNGTATFPALKISQTGTYALTASVNGGGPSTSAVTIAIGTSQICPDGVTGDTTFNSGAYTEQGSLDIGGLRATSCTTATVTNSNTGVSQVWEIDVNKPGATAKVQGYLPIVWEFPGTDPTPWTKVSWKTNVGGTLVSTSEIDLPRCNASAVTTPMPSLGTAGYDALFPNVTVNVGGDSKTLPAGACVYQLSLDASNGTYFETDQVAVNEDLRLSKG
jgi:hypothetical protein